MIEEVKNINWNSMKGRDKHMVLMYLYRLETDIQYIEDYIETHWVREKKLNIDLIPEKIINLSAIEKRRMAYAAIGAKLEEIQ